MKATILAVLAQPAVLALIVSGVLYLLGVGVKAFHDFLVSWAEHHQSKAQQVLALFLGLVDTALTSSVSGITVDVKRAQADGVITAEELKQIAANEVRRLKAVLGDNLLVVLSKGLGIGGAALDAYLTQLAADKLGFKLLPAK